MLDSIHLWLGKESISNTNLLVDTPCFLDEIAEHKKKDQYSITGKLSNLKVFICQSGISIKGSLPKFYLGDNFQTLQRADTQLAFEKLEDKLHLPITQSRVTRVDIAQNFVIKYKPEAYYNYMGECLYFKRLPNNHSIYYRNQNRTKLFYDKIVEGRKKGYSIPDIWIDSQVLRYEYRLNKRVAQSLKMDEIKGNDLYSEPVYLKMINEYVSEYENIDKLKTSVDFDMDKMKSPKDFFNQIVLMKINEIGQIRALELVEELRAKDVFGSKKEYYSRLKKEIKKICSTPGITETTELIGELNQKIRAVKENYR